MNVTQRMAGNLKPGEVVKHNGERLRIRHINRAMAGVIRLHFQPADEPLDYLVKNETLVLSVTALTMFEVEDATL